MCLYKKLNKETVSLVMCIRTFVRTKGISRFRPDGSS